MKYVSQRLSAIMLTLVFSSSPLFAQESETPEKRKADEIVVPGGRPATSIEKAGTTTTITAQDIEEKSSKLLKDTLTQVPGMQVETQRKGTRTFTMRGYGMSKVAMLVDGIPVMDTYSGSMDIDNIGLLDVSDIIISRGTSSALYGTKGVVGSINIIKAPPKKLYLKVIAEADHLYNHVLSFAQGGPIGNFYYMVSGSYDKMDGYNTSKKLNRKTREEWLRKLTRYDLYSVTSNLQDFYDGVIHCAVPDYLLMGNKFEHVSHEKYKTNGKFGYHITQNLDAGVTAFYNTSEMKNSSFYTEHYSVFRSDGSAGGRTWQSPSAEYVLQNISNSWPDYNDYAISPYLNYKNGKFELKMNAFFYEQYNRYMSFEDPEEREPRVGDRRLLTWSIWTNQTYGFNIYPSFKISENQKISFVATYYIGSHIAHEQAFDNYSTDIIQYQGTGKYKLGSMKAGYLMFAIEDEIRLGKNTELSFGISYDSQNIIESKERNSSTAQNIDSKETAGGDAMLWGTQDALSPVVGIISQLTDDLSLRASASYKTAFPSLQAYNNTYDWVQKNSATYNEVKLTPERSLNGNIGVEISFFEKQFTIGCDYFYSYYFDKLVRYYQAHMEEYVYRNMDFSYIQGAETTFNWSLGDVLNAVDLSLSFTHTYLHARNLSKVRFSAINKGRYIEHLPEHKFTVDFKAWFYKTNTSIFIFGYYEYNQIQYAMKYRPEGVYANPINPELSEPNWHFTTDCFEPVRLNNPLMIDVKISQKVLRNYEVYLLCKNIFDDYRPDPFNPGPGRMFYAGLKAEW